MVHDVMLRLSALFWLIAAPVFAEMQLVMVEEPGCVWCARWNTEIGPIYPKTALGETAPLRRIDIHAPVPAELDLKRGLSFTPTFILVDDGREIGRLEGYPGEDFFWGLMEKMVAEARPGQEDLG